MYEGTGQEMLGEVYGGGAKEGRQLAREIHTRRPEKHGCKNNLCNL